MQFFTDAVKAKGVGRAYGHHGEVVQGMFPTPDGGTCRGLVTLPCHLFHSTATFRPSVGSPLISSAPNKSKSLAAARLTLDEIGLRDMGGVLTIENDIPLSWGLGSSTADVTATIRALCDAFRLSLSAHQIARLAVRAETASDPIMFDDCAMVFAHRAGHVIEALPGSFPSVEVLGFNTAEGTDGVDTLALPPAGYDEEEVQAFRPIVTLLRRAVADRDSSLLGLAATASARINQRFLPKPNFDGLIAIAGQSGAIGIQVAHSGTIAGLLFDPVRAADLEARFDRARMHLAEVGITDHWRFRTGSSVGCDRE